MHKQHLTQHDARGEHRTTVVRTKSTGLRDNKHQQQPEKSYEASSDQAQAPTTRCHAKPANSGSADAR